MMISASQQIPLACFFLIIFNYFFFLHQHCFNKHIYFCILYHIFQSDETNIPLILFTYHHIFNIFTLVDK